MIRPKTFRSLILTTCLALLAWPPATARAQVPKFQQTPYALLHGLRSLDVTTRRSSASGLARFRRNATARKALIAALLQDPDVSVRQNAAMALAKMGSKAKPALIRAAVCDPDPSTRQGLAAYARSAILRCDNFDDPLGEADPLPRVEERQLAFLGHPGPANRLAAVKALKKARSAKGYQRIWQLASQDPVHSLRALCLRTAVGVYKEKTLPAIRHTLTQDPDARVRATALYALAHLKHHTAAKTIATSAKVEQIAEIQLAAVKALGKLANKRAITELRGLARSHNSEDVRATALELLIKLKGKGKSMKKLLARAMQKDPSGKVRAVALKALSTDVSSSACKARVGSLGDPHPAVRKALVSQLAKCKARIALPALRKVLEEDGNGNVRREAVGVLIAMQPKGLAALLAWTLPRDADAEVRKVVLAGMIKLKTPDLHNAMARIVRNDDDLEMRQVAVENLARMGAAKAVKPLAYALQNDSSEVVRKAAIRALERYRDPLAYTSLTRAAKADSSAKLRGLAGRAAARSPAHKAWITGLLPQTIDPESDVRLKAVVQLCKLKVPRTYRALIHAFWMDSDTRIRKAVARGFAAIDHPLIDVGLVVAHDTDGDSGLVREVERTQAKRVDRLNRILDKTKSAEESDRLTAIESLVPSPFKRVRVALERMLLEDVEASVRRASAQALGEYGDRKALDILLKASQKELHTKTRKTVVKLYNTLRSRWLAARRALDLNSLMQDMRTGSAKDRIKAAQALGILKDRQAFSALKAGLRSKKPELRYEAVLAMAIFGDINIVSKMARSEKNKKVAQRLIALNLLRKAPRQRVLTALASENQQDIRVAVNALAIKPDLKAVPLLARVALSNVDTQLRLSAVRTLVLHDHPMAHWAIRVAALLDASKKARAVMWTWAVLADANKAG